MSPIIGFTSKDLLRGTVVTVAWYRVRIEQVGEQLAKKGDSTNYPVEAIIMFNADDGSTEFANVPIDWNFNSKALGFAVGYLKALGIEVKEGTRYDLGATATRELDVFIENQLYEGRTINKVNYKFRAPMDAPVS